MARFNEIRREKKSEKNTKSYNISVIGFSGPVELEEKRKDATDSIIDGIGKSSFCARFMYPHQDDYNAIDKRSIISPIDFGSKLINNHNTLWWGNKREDGLTYSILEHTVFLDDSRLEPFESRNSKADKYENRCAESIFKNWTQKQFLGFSNQQDNESTPMIPDKFKIDAFLILIDVSKDRLEKQTLTQQLEFVRRILKNIKLKTHPVVLGLTKFDRLGQFSHDISVSSSTADINAASEFNTPSSDIEDEAVKYIRIFFKRPEIVKKLRMKHDLPIVETSAERNINISETFKLLAHLIDKTKNKNYPKIPEIRAYKDQVKILEKKECEAFDSYNKMLKEEVIRYDVEWKSKREKLTTTENGPFKNFLQIFGSDLAYKAFKERIKNLKNLYKGTIIQGYKIYIELALNSIITDIAQLKPDWDELMEQVEKANNFSDWFIILKDYDSSGYNYEKKQFWFEDDHVCSLTDKRIPFHLLKMKLPDNDTAGHNFRNDLLKKLTRKFLEGGSNGSVTGCDSLDTSLNDSFDYLASDHYSEHSPLTGKHAIQRSSSTTAIMSRARLQCEKIETHRGRWSWNGGENLKIILLGSEGLTKELAEEIQEDNKIPRDEQSEDSLNSSLEVIKVEENYGEGLKSDLIKRRPHGCIAVYSNRKTFQFCQKWLREAVLDENAAFKGLPVSVLMATDHDLDDHDKNVLIKEGQDLVAELTRTDSSTGRFVAPEGGSYMNMKRIQKIQIKEGLHNFVHELKKIAGFKVMNTNKTPPRPILIGVGSCGLDRGPCEKLQKYLIDSGCTLVNDSAKLMYPHPRIHFQFFDCTDQANFKEFDSLVICFSQSNGQNLCHVFMNNVLGSKPELKVQFVIGQSDRADALKKTTEDKFPQLTSTHPILTSSDLCSNNLTELESIIISGQANRDTRNLDDNTSTFDINSNIESSVGDSISNAETESVDSFQKVSHLKTKYEMSIESSSIITPREPKLTVGKIDPNRIVDLNARLERSLRKSLPSITSSSIDHIDLDQSGSVKGSSAGLLYTLFLPTKSSKHSTGSSDSEKARKTPKTPKRNSFRNKMRGEEKERADREEYNSTESLDQLGISVDNAVTFNNTINSTVESAQQTPRISTDGLVSRPHHRRPWSRRPHRNKTPANNLIADASMLSQQNNEEFKDSKYFQKALGDYFDHDTLGYPGLVPAFIKEIVQKLEELGLETEGLYRVPADRKKRQELLKYFDATFKIGGTLNYDVLTPAPNTLAGCIQWYISSKNLPEPIIPSKFLRKLQDAIKPPDEDEKIDKLRIVFTELGAEKEAHWQTIKYLCEHFLRVSQYSQTNQMHARNIATCLFPTFFPPDAKNFSPATFNTDSCIFIDILVLLIEKGDKIFRDEPELVKQMKENIMNARVSGKTVES